MTDQDASTAEVEPSLISRVRKLMDKASATSNAHEADAFSRKAAELIARHRIDPESLAESVRDDLAIREIALGRGAYVRARLALLMAVSEAHDSRVVFATTPTGTVAYVAGRSSDLDLVDVLYTSLHAQAAARMSMEHRATAAATQRHRRSFLFGYADRVAKSFDDARRHAQASSPERRDVDLAVRSPARLEQLDRVDRFVAERFGRVRAARSAAGAEVRGWTAGSEAAERADLGRKRVDGRRSLGPG